MFTKERVMIIKKDFTLQNYTHTYINSKYSWLLSQEIFLGWLFSQEKDNILVEISTCLCIYLILINYPNLISFTDFSPDRSFVLDFSSIHNNICSSGCITPASSPLPFLDTTINQGYILYMGTNCTLCEHHVEVWEVEFVAGLRC